MCCDGKNRPIVDPQVCVGCGECVNECPGGAEIWFEWNGLWLPHVLKCCATSCNGECFNVCPVNALSETPCPA